MTATSPSDDEERLRLRLARLSAELREVYEQSGGFHSSRASWSPTRTVAEVQRDIADTKAALEALRDRAG